MYPRGVLGDVGSKKKWDTHGVFVVNIAINCQVIHAVAASNSVVSFLLADLLRQDLELALWYEFWFFREFGKIWRGFPHGEVDE